MLGRGSQEQAQFALGVVAEPKDRTCPSSGYGERLQSAGASVTVGVTISLKQPSIPPASIGSNVLVFASVILYYLGSHVTEHHSGRSAPIL